MLRWFNLTAMLLLVLAAGFMAVSEAGARVDWETLGTIQLDGMPVSVAGTESGDKTFVLTDQSRVVIYDAEGKLVGSVPVDPAVTDIDVSAKGERLYLVNGKSRTLQTVDIGYIVEFNVADSPFLGPAGAPVAVAVFSDFQ